MNDRQAQLMTRWPAWLLLAVLLAATALAADPEFKTGIVTASRVYERESGSVNVGGLRTAMAKEWTSRVTVAVDGERITGEWQPKTVISATAKDFPRGADVPVAVKRGQLLLKHPDGSVVTARIVDRRRQPTAENERD
jgi:hypothetical protein